MIKETCNMKRVEQRVTKIVFESIDGKHFDDEKSCEDHEIFIAKDYFIQEVRGEKKFHESAINEHKRSGLIRISKGYSVNEYGEEMKDCYTTRFAQGRYKMLIKEYKDTVKTGRKKGEPLYKWYMRIGKIINDLIECKWKVKQAEHNLRLHKEKVRVYRLAIKNFEAGCYTDRMCWKMLIYNQLIDK